MRVLKKKVMKEGIVKEIKSYDNTIMNRLKLKREKKKEGIKELQKENEKVGTGKIRIPCLCLY
jgi:ribosomal protein S21